MLDRPRMITFAAWGTAALLVLSACSDRDEPSARPRSTTTTSTPSASSSTSSTTVAPPTGDLDQAQVKLTQVYEEQGITAIASRSGDPRLYMTEQLGRVLALQDGNTTTVLDIESQVGSGGERGLLGLTFSPDGSKLSVNFTNRDGDTRVDEYAMSADGTANPASRRELLAVDQPQPNHNGGAVITGPDGMLYIGLGDGGAAGDQGSGHAAGGNGQSLDTLLGKILRIDPTPSGGAQYTIPADNPFAAGGGRPEIWMYGLRNPWKFSFDRATDDMWIADVGQNEWEEIDLATPGHGAGTNFGWNVFEGTHRYRDGDAPGARPPIFEYSHTTGGCSISGGYVYRGTRIPALAGSYVYSDYCDGEIRAITQDAGEVKRQRGLDVRSDSVAGIGQDAAGELYVISQSNGIYRIDPA